MISGFFRLAGGVCPDVLALFLVVGVCGFNLIKYKWNLPQMSNALKN